MPLLRESLLPLVLVRDPSSIPYPMGPLPWSTPVPYQEDQAEEHQQENHSHQDHNNYGPRRERIILPHLSNTETFSCAVFVLVWMALADWGFWHDRTQVHAECESVNGPMGS